MCEYLSVRGSICACCSGTNGWHQGHSSLFSMWFHLVRRGMVFHLNTLGLVPVATLLTSLFLSLLSTTPEISEADGACNTNRETCRCTQSFGSVYCPQSCVSTRVTVNDSYPRPVSHSVFCPLLNIWTRRTSERESRHHTLYSLSSPSEGSDHICDITPLSPNQISLSPHLKHPGFVLLKVM